MTIFGPSRISITRVWPNVCGHSRSIECVGPAPTVTSTTDESIGPRCEVMRVALDRLRSEACQGLPGCLLVVALGPLLTNSNVIASKTRQRLSVKRFVTRATYAPGPLAGGSRRRCAIRASGDVEVMSTPDGRWPKNAGGTAIIGMPGSGTMAMSPL